MEYFNPRLSRSLRWASRPQSQLTSSRPNFHEKVGSANKPGAADRDQGEPILKRLLTSLQTRILSPGTSRRLTQMTYGRLPRRAPYATARLSQELFTCRNVNQEEDWGGRYGM